MEEIKCDSILLAKWMWNLRLEYCIAYLLASNSLTYWSLLMTHGDNADGGEFMRMRMVMMLAF